MSNCENKPSLFAIGKILALFLMSAFIAYQPFRLVTRPIISTATNNILMFYGRGQIQTLTLVWYVLSLSILLGIQLLQRKGLIKPQGDIPVSWIAWLFAPSVFADPSQLNSLAKLLAPHVHHQNEAVTAIILPAWVCIIHYSLQSTSPYIYDAYRWVAIVISFWPIPAIWFILLVIKRFWFCKNLDS